MAIHAELGSIFPSLPNGHNSEVWGAGSPGILFSGIYVGELTRDCLERLCRKELGADFPLPFLKGRVAARSNSSSCLDGCRTRIRADIDGDVGDGLAIVFQHPAGIANAPEEASHSS